MQQKIQRDKAFRKIKFSVVRIREDSKKMRYRGTISVLLGSIFLVLASRAMARAIRVDNGYWTIFAAVPADFETSTGGLEYLSGVFYLIKDDPAAGIFSNVDPGVGPTVPLWVSMVPEPYNCGIDGYPSCFVVTDDSGSFPIAAGSSYLLSWDNPPPSLLPIPSPCTTELFDCPAAYNPLLIGTLNQIYYPGPTAQVGIYYAQYVTPDPVNEVAEVDGWEIVFNYGQSATTCPAGLAATSTINPPTFTASGVTYEFTGAGGVTSPCSSGNDILFSLTGVLIGYVTDNGQQMPGLPPGWSELVPSVFELSESDATTALTGASLTVGTVAYGGSNTIAAGLVISQNPLAGAGVPPGSAVNLVISSGPLRGDINGDGHVDKLDLALITSALNRAATGANDFRDLNHDGVINALDARILVTLCTHPRCATN